MAAAWSVWDLEKVKVKCRSSVPTDGDLAQAHGASASFPTDARATPNAGWEGNIQNTKWRNEEGNVPDGRKGKTEIKPNKAFTFYQS